MWDRWGKIALAVSILVLLLLEWRDPEFRQGWSWKDPRFRRNLPFLVASVLVMLWLPAGGEWLRLRVPPLVRWHGRWLPELVACFLVAELLGWALHYVKHRNAWLWSFHFQHHRESHYNVWLSAHTHGLEVVVSGLLTVGALCLLGFSKPVATAYLLFYSFAKVYQHSARDYTLGALDRLVVSPRYHRLHHEVDSRCNYGVSLTLFDLLFRTARWPSPHADPRAIRYGIDDGEPLPFGFWAEMVYFLQRSGRGEGVVE